MGRKGRKHVLAEGTGSVPRGHHTPLTAAGTCLWLGSGCSVHRWKCQPFGIWGFGHQGPAAKALPPMSHPIAVLTYTGFVVQSSLPLPPGWVWASTPTASPRVSRHLCGS